MADRNMQGKRAIVTGGGTGLGAATAVGLAKRGANICINYNSSADAANEVDRLRSTVTELVKGGVLAVAMDLCLPRLFLEVAEILVDTVQGRDARIDERALTFMRFQIKQAGIKQFPGDVAKVWDAHSNLKPLVKGASVVAELMTDPASIQQTCIGGKLSLKG